MSWYNASVNSLSCASVAQRVHEPYNLRAGCFWIIQNNWTLWSLLTYVGQNCPCQIFQLRKKGVQILLSMVANIFYTGHAMRRHKESFAYWSCQCATVPVVVNPPPRIVPVPAVLLLISVTHCNRFISLFLDGRLGCSSWITKMSWWRLRWTLTNNLKAEHWTPWGGDIRFSKNNSMCRYPLIALTFFRVL